MTISQKIVIILTLLSAGLFVAGAFVLLGLGWSLLSAAVVLAAMALILVKGMTNENQNAG